MAITTLDGVIAGLQPSEEYIKVSAVANVAHRFYSLAYSAGRPIAVVVPSPGMAGAALTSYGGQLPFTNGAAKQYLARFSMNAATETVTMILYDRLWHNSGIDVTSTSAQTIDSVAWPARDNNASTNGEGIRIGLEVSTLTGAGASVHSISYTNQAGTAGRTGSPRVAYSAVSNVGVFYDYTLDAGDTGVRSVQSFTSTVSMTSGAVHLVAYRELARINCLRLGDDFETDAVTAGMPEAFDDTVPFLFFIPRAGTAIGLAAGRVVWTHG